MTLCGELVVSTAVRRGGADSTVLNDAGATQGHDHPARRVLASASRPQPAPGVRHIRAGRRSRRKGAPSEAPTTWLPSVHDGAVKCGLGVRTQLPA